MYIGEGIEFIMMFGVDFGIFSTCKSGTVNVYDSSSINCASTVELVIVLVVREEGMFFRIIRLSISFVFILVVIL
jgi:hypothetical protein